MTSPATSDRHLLKLEKRPKMPPQTAKLNFSGAAFCLQRQLVGILLGVRQRRSRRRSSQSDSVVYRENGLTWNHQILHDTSHGPDRTTPPDMTSLTTSGRTLSTFEKRSKIPPQTASGEVPRERFKRGSPNFTQMSVTTGPTNLSDMTSLVAFLVTARYNYILHKSGA